MTKSETFKERMELAKTAKKKLTGKRQSVLDSLLTKVQTVEKKNAKINLVKSQECIFRMEIASLVKYA